MRSKLRHPIRAIREPFGTAGLIVACVALIAALGGSAIAAKGALTGKQKKEVEKIAKKFAGKPGVPGAAGPAGAPGAPGAPGAKGDTGAAGTNGTNGTNGKDGTDGETGFTETLPPGKTETGMYSGTYPLVVNAPQLQSGEQAEANLVITFSFNIPMDTSTYTVNYIDPAGVALVGNLDNCPGTKYEPEAKPNNFCIYALDQSGVESPTNASFPLNTVAGSVMQVKAKAPASVIGTWAITAPTSP